MTKEKRNELFSENINLVYTCTNKYQNRSDYEDLLQEAYLAFVKALDKYDENLGFKLSTYCVKCIESSILSFITRNKKIYFSSRLHDNYWKINRYCKENNKDVYELDRNDYNKLKDIYDFTDLDISEIHDFLHDDFMTSLNAPITSGTDGEAKDLCLQDTIIDTSSYIEGETGYKFLEEELEDECIRILDEKIKPFVSKEVTYNIYRDIIECTVNGESLSKLCDKYGYKRQYIYMLKIKLFNTIKKYLEINKKKDYFMRLLS